MKQLSAAVEAAGPEAPGRVRAYHHRTLALVDRLSGPARLQALRWSSGNRPRPADWEAGSDQLQAAIEGTGYEAAMLGDYLGDVTLDGGRILEGRAGERIHARMAAGIAIHIRQQVTTAQALVSEPGNDDAEWKSYAKHCQIQAETSMIEALS